MKSQSHTGSLETGRGKKNERRMRIERRRGRDETSKWKEKQQTYITFCDKSFLWLEGCSIYFGVPPKIFSGVHKNNIRHMRIAYSILGKFKMS